MYVHQLRQQGKIIGNFVIVHKQSLAGEDKFLSAGSSPLKECRKITVCRAFGACINLHKTHKWESLNQYLRSIIIKIFMARSQETISKKENEKKRIKRKQDKEEKREERKAN